ncbi:hypothetical protein [Endozoicomonas atrinae]|uniref:hypothetical protein n=1 Tax=Endozoicomonas atrinae TaxID=1333660 RepID=UPI003B00B907
MLLGKIWTRLYFNLANIAKVHLGNIKTNPIEVEREGKKVKKNIKVLNAKGKGTKDTNAAKIMRFNVIALLHAILFEEAAYHKVNSEFSLDLLGDRANPVTSVRQFGDKLKRITEQDVNIIKEQLPIFYCLATCPLLYPFLIATGSIIDNGRSKTDEDNFRSSFKTLLTSVYGELATKLETSGIQYLNKVLITATTTDTDINQDTPDQ